MNFEGEHLLLGQVGHFAAVLSLVAALIACISFFQAERTQNEESIRWKKMGRMAYLINAISVFLIFLVLSLIIYNHYFEYKYAHQHSKRSLDMQYLFSCFWEGQEGSFMLWNFWQAVLGLVLIRTAKKWENAVMTIISLSQFFMASFLIGIYFFDVKLGSSPFVLMRNEFPEAPIFKDPQYLFKYLLDGNGLNILLQNYWMVIHPPVLFLGFATSIVPFAYAIAGLWKNEHKEWLRPAFPWALFNGAILGLGIMMGAAWAYESLTFGGYWAWDPVENASLVPWMLMVAGIHTMLINKSTGHSFKATYLFIPASFLLVLYSTFLTRTGVLGETSVHSFTGEGNSLYWHLLFMIVTFLIIPVLLYLKRRKTIPAEIREENMNSREFWMFVGALLLFVSACYIIILTSLPFINSLLDTHWAIGKDVEYVYNRVMILVSFVIAILTAITQFFRYKDTTKKQFWSKLLMPSLVTLIISVIISFIGNIHFEKYGIGFLIAIHISLWASIYTIIANASYIISVLKWKMKAAGASITHLGFGLMLAGILISSSKKELISINKTGIAVSGLKDVKGNEENPLENVTLVQGIPTSMGNYTVTYEADSTVERNNRVYFRIHFQRHDHEDSTKVIESFNIYPNAFLVKGEQGMNLSSNPGSKHYLNKDIFVYITSWLNPDKLVDTASFRNTWVKEGDTVFYSSGYIVVKEVMTANKHDNADLPVVDSAWLSNLEIHANDGRGYVAQPAFFVKDLKSSVKTDTVIAQNMILQINGAKDKKIELGIRESNKLMRYITMKAYSFPMINVLWLGTIVMVAGFLISMFHRLKSLKSE